MKESATPKPKRLIRLDSLPLGQTHFTAEGYLMDRPILTSVGIFEYKNPDGSTRRELRLPEEVFDPESLASYKSKPIIITHDAGLIDKSNVREESIGTILSEGYRSGDDVRAEIVIHDTEAMRASKLKELSLGYNLDLEETAGEWNGQPYDAIQRNIRINHLALVREARAGEQARLNIDGRDSEKKRGGKGMEDKKTIAQRKRGETRGDGVLSPEELSKAIAEYKAKHLGAGTAEDAAPSAVADKDAPDAPPAPTTGEDIESRIRAARETDGGSDPEKQKLFDIIDSLLAERDFKAAADSADKETAPAEPASNGDSEATPATEEDCGDKKGFDGNDKEEDLDSGEKCEDAASGTVNADSVDAMIRDRIQVGMMGQALNLDGLENLKLMDARRAVIKAVRPTMNLDGRSDAYINGVYAMACADVRSRNVKDTRYQKRQMFNRDSRQAASADSDSAASARDRMIARQQGRNDKEGK